MKFAHFEFDPRTDRLGEGPLSEVYRAVDTGLGRTVALKILRAHAEIDPAADQRFHREARNTSKLDHPNIATVFEYGKDQGTSYIAMEYLEGQPLDRILKEGLLGFEECLRIGLELCGALAHVHQNGLIHRDLKPGNIMVLHDGSVKLLDFGIARATNESSITQVGMLVGTVLYMAPEQVRGDELDFRSDVFALGSVLYHMMTGALPFPGKSFPEVCMAILDGNVRPPSLVRSGFPQPLEKFITRCLATEPSKRFPDAQEAYGALLSASESIARSTPSPAPCSSRPSTAALWTIRPTASPPACARTSPASWRASRGWRSTWSRSRSPTPPDPSTTSFAGSSRYSGTRGASRW
jgi:serine/threonine protein kinase